MELLLIVLNKTEYLEKLISTLIEAGIQGVTISDSEGIGHYLAFEVPIFAGLRQFFQEGKSISKTILAVLEDEESYLNFKKLIAQEGLDFTQPGVGIMAKIPAVEIIKSQDEME